MLRIIPAIVILIPALLVTARVDTVQPNDFLSFSIDCQDHRIKILTQTLDPFSGVIYVQPMKSLRQGYKGQSFCKSIGRGRHEISIEVGAGQCGWKRDGERVRLDLYVQYDAHVQQVVDEKITVECNMATREGKMVMESDREEDIVMQHSNEMSVIVRDSMGEMTVEEENEEIKAAIIPETRKRARIDNNPRRTDPKKRGRMDDIQRKLVGWLEITEGSIPGGHPVSRSLEEGEYVMVAAKVKQDEGMDTMMTRCGMDDGHNEVQFLSDERGCSLNSDIFGNIQSSYNAAKKVKEMFVNFKVPKFGGERHLVLKCIVVSCEGLCPVAPCESRNAQISMRDMLILETEADVRQAVEQKQKEADVVTPVDSNSYTAVEKVQMSSELCLSPARIVVAFGTLLLILVLALLFSCVLWMKARRRIMPHSHKHKHHRQRGPLIVPNLPRPYIRVHP